MISSPCTVRLTYSTLVETGMVLPLTLLTTVTTETKYSGESSIDGVGSGITCVLRYPSFCKDQG